MYDLRASTRQCPTWRLAALVVSALALPGAVQAGPIGMISTLANVLVAYVVVVLVVALIALFVCRWIVNRRWRLLARVLILIVLFTPIPSNNGNGTFVIAPAFLMAMGSTMGSGVHAEKSGPFSHPFLFAYGVALTIAVSWFMLWTRVAGPPPPLAVAARERPAPSPAPVPDQ